MKKFKGIVIVTALSLMGTVGLAVVANGPAPVPTKCLGKNPPPSCHMNFTALRNSPAPVPCPKWRPGCS